MPLTKTTGAAPRKPRAKSDPGKPQPILELGVVTLGKPVDTKQGTIPTGSSGTVIHVFGDGVACIVEFYEPFHAVATVEADAIEA